MADEAAVVLSANDAITAPVMKAVASLQQLQDTLKSLSTASMGLPAASNAAASGVGNLGNAAEAAVVPHRAAHQAMNLVSASMADMAGASAGAHAGLRVLDSIMFSIFTTGGAISLTFIAIAAAAAGVGAVMRNVSEATKATAAEMEALTKKNQDAVLALDKLSTLQRQVAASSAGMLSREMIANTSAVADANGAYKKLRETVTTVAPGLREMGDRTREFVTSTRGSNEEIEKARQNFLALKLKGEELEKTFKDLTQASRGLGKSGREDIGALGASLRNLGTTDMTDKIIRDALRARDAMKAMSRYSTEALNEMMNKADAAGVTYTKFFDVVIKTDQIIMAAVADMAAQVGQAIGNALVSGKMMWDDLLIGMVKTCLQAMKQIGAMWMAASLMVSAGLGPQGFAMGLGLVLAASVAEGVIGAMESKAKGFSQPSFSSSASTAAGVSAGGAQTGVGGTAISSSNNVINNYINTTVPVEALDLSSVSDAQMRSLANRIARLIAQGASGGQFSLVGA